MKCFFLDSHPLGLLSNPLLNKEGSALTAWVKDVLNAGHRLYIPEVIDYELRRELVRAAKTSSIAELDALKNMLHYLPITTDAMVLAANLWAQTSNAGTPTGDPKKLDIDVILAAQSLTEAHKLSVPHSDITVVTSNVSHLARFVNAAAWVDIHPYSPKQRHGRP